MKALPDFRLETQFAKWEFKARHHMTASDAESLSIRDLLAMATAGEREEFENLWLGYTETFGAPDLREVIAEMYPARNADEVLCFAGASEGIFAANRVILDQHSHAVAITPITNRTSRCRSRFAIRPGFRSTPTITGRSISTGSRRRSNRIPGW